MTADTAQPHPMIGAWQRRALVAAVGGGALCVIGAVTSVEQFFRSYLIAYLFWLGIALGCLGIGLLHNLTGGGWGAVIRRLLDSGMRTLPFMALLFVPILIGLPHIYEWTHADVVAADPLLQHKAAYLNVPFLIGRAAFYFAVWIGFATLSTRTSAVFDTEADPAAARRLKTSSAPGVLLYVLTMSFASIDWVMSLDPHWFSTIYGVLFIVGQVLSAMGFAITILATLSDREPVAGSVTTDHFHDLGNLLFAFVFLWAYLAVSQLLIIWSANNPEEIPWYLKRFRGGWETIGYALVLFHFALPFLLLLSRRTKRRAQTLAAVALFIIVMHFVEMFWVIAPEFHEGGFGFHWMDIVAPIAVGGIWLSLYFRNLRGRPVLALHDPSLAGEGAHAE